ncbi:hypothetical protein BGZ63DRAFT_466674 [Mariannaea sp. PMI_226]|nr:hypothetical protein BGZ63DRAFT_466674 [Mariannaea sp. PMI_226]
MARIYDTYKLSIVKHHLKKDLPKDLMQLVLAIALFPKGDALRAESHLNLWACGTFPDLIETPNPELIGCGSDKLIYDVYNIVSKLKLFIQDYLNKTARKNLRKACSELPYWCTMTPRIDLQTCPEGGISITDLSKDEQYRFMKAFLQYELMCKLHPLQPARDRSQLHPTEWDWIRLFTLESAHAEDETKVDTSGPELLQCVHEYLRTLYGAIILSHYTPFVSPSKYPGTDICITNEGQFPFPYSEQFHPELMLQIFDPVQNGRNISFFDYLASCGFDLAMSFLTSKHRSYPEMLNRLWDEISWRKPQHVARSIPATYEPTVVDSRSSSNFRYARIRFHQVRGYHITETSWRSTLRQRGWAFFDDDRFYPLETRFQFCHPCDRYGCGHIASRQLATSRAWSALYHLQDTSRWNAALLHLWVREFVPTVKLLQYQSPWLNEIGTETWTYPTLNYMVKEPFWKQRLDGIPQL